MTDPIPCLRCRRPEHQHQVGDGPCLDYMPSSVIEGCDLLALADDLNGELILFEAVDIIDDRLEHVGTNSS